MKRQGIIPDVTIFNSLIDGFFKSRNTKEALNFLNKLKEYNIKPDRVTLQIVNHMKARGIKVVMRTTGQMEEN